MFNTFLASTVIVTSLLAAKPANVGRNIDKKVGNQVASRSLELKQEREQAREEFRTSTASAQERRQALLEKFSEIKDERKKSILEKLQGNVTDRQQRWGEHWSDVLTRLGTILDKIESVGGTTAEVTTARASIQAAQTAIDDFKAQTYEVSFESEDTVGQHMSTLVQQFKSDSKDVFSLIKQAKDDVKAAAQAAKGSQSDTETETSPTPTATTSS